MTPVQRAAALKQQQKYLRELEEANKPEYEKSRHVMSLGFNKAGKLVRTYQKESIKPSDDVDVQEQETSEIVQAATGEGLGRGSGAFSNNPLIGSGLIRPLWKAKDGEQNDEKGKEREGPSRSVWRRVQDDADNEQWVI
jgi:hypothetical protein